MSGAQNNSLSKERSEFPAVCLQKFNGNINLPGLIYRYRLPKDLAFGGILSHYKSSDFKGNFIIKNIGVSGREESLITSECYQTVQSFHQVAQQAPLHLSITEGAVSSGASSIKSDTDTADKIDMPLYLALITNIKGDVHFGTACKISSCVMDTDDEHVILTLKSICRIKGYSHSEKTTSPGSLYILKDVQFEKSTSSILDNSKSLDLSYKTSLIDAITHTDTVMKNFITKYKTSLKIQSGKTAYLSSPLVNILYVHLSSQRFQKTWTSVVENLMNFTILEFSSLVDLLIGILPTSKIQRLIFLEKFDVPNKFECFINILNKDFAFLFENLETIDHYINSNYSNLTSSEKTKIIATQLKSIKSCLDSLSSSKNGNITPSAPIKNTNGNLSSENNDESDDLDNIRSFLTKMDKKNINKEGQKILQRDFKRLVKMNPQTAEYQQLRNYFDNILDIPFGLYDLQEKGGGRGKYGLEDVQNILDQDHYGLQKVKARILEYLCVYNITSDQSLVKQSDLQNETTSKNKQNTSPTILLLDGPPGVGKTSIAKSIAKVMNRNFQRISLGGIYNESDIRGHRRTYVGAMNGLVINALKKAQTMNPVILLDELDKIFSGVNGNMASSNNGNPSAALLEVLDPQQNSTFVDHYVGFPIDLSQIVFICTSNESHNIPAPLLDRMETIELSSYLFSEKKQIAERYLLPKQIELNGLNQLPNYKSFTITDDAWKSLILNYTQEAGVRGLDRKLGALVRNSIMNLVGDSNNVSREITIDKSTLVNVFGQPRYDRTAISDKYIANSEHEEDNLGIVNGLSYNSDGTGSVLVFEILKTGETKDENENESANGPNLSMTTGNLGNTLLESIEIGCSIIKNMTFNKYIKKNSKFLKSQYHLHVPEGGISKDGPSAGLAITLALLSLAINKPIGRDICMTGEITLKGHILPIGGLREKLFGASMNNMQTVLVPIDNANDLQNMCLDNSWCSADEFLVGKLKELDIIKEKLNIRVHYVSSIYDAMAVVWNKDEVFGNKANFPHFRNDELASSLL